MKFKIMQGELTVIIVGLTAYDNDEIEGKRLEKVALHSFKSNRLGNITRIPHSRIVT